MQLAKEMTMAVNKLSAGALSRGWFARVGGISNSHRNPLVVESLYPFSPAESPRRSGVEQKLYFFFCALARIVFIFQFCPGMEIPWAIEMLPVPLMPKRSSL